MQNEELRMANETAETALKKYTMLYDLAPIGYFILTPDGSINDLNFTGADMLKDKRFSLLNSNFKLYISDESKGEFNRFFSNLYVSLVKESCNVKLGYDNTPLCTVYMEGIVADDDQKCLLSVVDIQKLGFHFVLVDLGVVELLEDLSAEQKEILNTNLNKMGLSLINDKKSILIERIKNAIVDLIYYTDKLPKTNFSDYLSEKLDYDYTYMANLFSQTLDTTIEQYIIKLKIERVKELLIYDEMNLSEIADKNSISCCSSDGRLCTKSCYRPQTIKPCARSRIADDGKRPIQHIFIGKQGSEPIRK